jgi:threonine/homoserine/homoserine lactone efflux protein
VAAALGQMLPIAVGVMVSPLPIVAVVLMLVSGHARANALAFLSAWFVAIGAVVVAVAVLAGGASSEKGSAASWTGWIKIGLGLVLVALAVREWRGRPRGDEVPPAPGWMRAVDGFTPVKAAGLAAVLGVVNPKNLLLVVAGGLAIASSAPDDTGTQVVAGVAFAIVASVGVAAPLVVYVSAGERAAQILDDLKDWMVRNNAAIMAVLLLVIGAKLVGDGMTIV